MALQTMKIKADWIVCDLSFSPPNTEGWMGARVRIKVPSFEGSFTCSIQEDEWRHFIDVLRKLESSVGNAAEASWSNMEQNVGFRFALNRRGRLTADYWFSPDNLTKGPTLSGTFEADQTYLRGWIRSARQVFADGA